MHLLKSVGTNGFENGCMIFCGTTISRLVHPPLPVPYALYLCDRKFHTEILDEMVAPKVKTGFVVCDGQTAIVASISGRQRAIHATIESMAKGRTRRGGQSSHRFERLRDEAEHEYVKKICEAMQTWFVGASADGGPAATVERVVLAGCAAVKTLVHQHAKSFVNLYPLISCLVDVPHGGLQGLGEAVARAGIPARPTPEVAAFLEALTSDTGLGCYGPAHVCEALRAGAVQVLLINKDATAALDAAAPAPGPAAAAAPAPDPDGGLVATVLRLAAASGARLVEVDPTTSDAVVFCTHYGLGALLRWRFDEAEAETDEFLDDVASQPGREPGREPDPTVAGPAPAPTPAPARASAPTPAGSVSLSPFTLAPQLPLSTIDATLTPAPAPAPAPRLQLNATAPEFVPGRWLVPN